MISERVPSLAAYTEKGEIRIPVILLLKDKAIFVKAPLFKTVPTSESITALNPRIVSLEPFSPTTRTGLEDVCLQSLNQPF